MVCGLAWRCRASRSVKNACRVRGQRGHRRSARALSRALPGVDEQSGGGRQVPVVVGSVWSSQWTTAACGHARHRCRGRPSAQRVHGEGVVKVVQCCAAGSGPCLEPRSGNGRRSSRPPLPRTSSPPACQSMSSSCRRATSPQRSPGLASSSSMAWSRVPDRCAGHPRQAGDEPPRPQPARQRAQAPRRDPWRCSGQTPRQESFDRRHVSRWPALPH